MNGFNQKKQSAKIGSTPSQRLVDYIQSLPDFEMVTTIDGNYGHVGATLADAVLQANNNYERNVRHRIARIRSIYAGHVRLSDLQGLLSRISIQEFLDWQGTRKPQTFRDLMDLLGDEGVDTEDEIRTWLQTPGARAKLLAIRFVGEKTADYLGILVGLPKVAMDRHLDGFLAEAGIGKQTYALNQDVIYQAADTLKVERAHLDHSIWRYMSSRAAEGAVRTRPIAQQIRRRRCSCE